MERRSEVLREFYSLVLHRDNDAAKGPPSCANGWRQDSEYSLDPGVQLRDLSSLGDLNRLDSTLAAPEEGLHDAAPIGPELTEPYSPSKPPQRLNEDRAALESALSQTKCKASQLKERIEDELSLLRNLNLDLQLGCQNCRLHKLGCDRARPSCWNCQQNFMQCHYNHGDTSYTQEEYQQSFYVPAEPVTESISWLDSLRHGLYYNLEEEGKLPHVDVSFLKSRYGHPTNNVPRRRRRRTSVEDTAEDRQKLLGRCSPALSENEASTPAVDTPAPSPCLPSLPPSRGASSSSHTGPPCSSVLTIALVFGEGTRSSLSTRPPSSSAGTTSSWLGPDSQPPSRKGDDGRVKSSSNSFGKSRVVNSSDDSPRLFQCTFCLKRFKGQRDWRRHEQLRHLPQQEWVCMPWGPTEEMDGKDTCVFCGVTDPNTTHLRQHKADPCYDREPKDRTYVRKEDMQEHLRTAHNQPTMSHCMKKWLWSPEDNAWYWNCGFCDLLLTSWTDRVEHISDHFKEGKAMSSWDPLMSPYPLHRTTLTCISWLPALYWDPETLLALEQKQRSQVNSDFPRTREAGEQEERPCPHCNAHVKGKLERKRHEDLWHLPREVWSCPTTNDVKAAIDTRTGPLARYLLTNYESPTVSDTNACPYCGELFSHHDGRDTRVEHLKVAHGFDKCQPAFKFTGRDRAMFHLANVHGVLLSEWTAGAVESCRGEQPPLAGPAERHTTTEPHDSGIIKVYRSRNAYEASPPILRGSLPRPNTVG